jgi:cell division protein FtsZ
MENPGSNSLLATTEKPVVKFFGIGNAGVTMLDLANTPEFAGADLVAVNTDANSLAACGATVKFHLENKLLRGLGSGGDAERGKALAEEQFSNLKAACEGANVVCILAGLGGGAGSGISPVLARAAREAGALVLAFVTLPFECEGNRREQQAQQSLEQLKLSADGVICLPSQKVFRLIDENTSLLETFRVTGGLLIEGLRGVWQLLTRPGLIQVHFADVCALVRDRHAENAFAFVEASGAGRSREVVEKILSHPLLDEGRSLAESDAVLVSLTAGKSLTMAEVNRVMSEVKRQCGRAQIIMGAAIDASLGEKLCVALIAAKQSAAPKAEEVSRTATARGGISLTATNQAETIQPRLTRMRRPGAKLVQTQLPLSIVSKGRFDKSEPTLHQGEDLDVPTFLRRGVVMN